MNRTLEAGALLRHGAWNYGVGFQKLRKTSGKSTPADQ